MKKLIDLLLWIFSTKPSTGSLYNEDTICDRYSFNELIGKDSEASDKPAILAVVSSILNRVVARNDAHFLVANRSTSPFKLTVFHGQRAPAIGIEKYLERIFKYANCSTSCFVVAYAYIDRFIYQQPDIPINSLNVHRLLITSVMVAAKFLDDAFYNNAYYAKIGGVATYEMNRLELEFLFRLNFRLQVTVTVFDRYCAHLAKEAAVCAPYQIEKCLQFGCGLDDASVEVTSEKQIVVTRCSYAGV
ncbi:hypothetical protein O6H91_07G026100 [Diphasiastrum complanatum]|uniref:Uncharacterized protein n=1 Tax=Diphasiastrum complanatum TaxID=34168 RepID=A0ACC2D3F7_DIPCM|nr:hypothetical protein O6H91_07G026100 [Diphasiastrum complanatum]